MKEPLVIEAEVVNGILQYLAQRPWGEVTEAIEALKKTPKLEMVLEMSGVTGDQKSDILESVMD